MGRPHPRCCTFWIHSVTHSCGEANRPPASDEDEDEEGGDPSARRARAPLENPEAPDPGKARRRGGGEPATSAPAAAADGAVAAAEAEGAANGDEEGAGAAGGGSGGGKKQTGAEAVMEKVREKQKRAREVRRSPDRAHVV